MGHSGFTMVVFKADLFSSYKDYSDRINKMEKRIRSVPAAPGFKGVLIPGDLERKNRSERIQNGIPIPENLWKTLVSIAKSLGIEKI